MSFLLATIDHHLSRIQHAAQTFLLRGDFPQRMARAEFERNTFDEAAAEAFLTGADVLAAVEAEQEVHEPRCVGPSMCAPDCARFGCAAESAHPDVDPRAVIAGPRDWSDMGSPLDDRVVTDLAAGRLAVAGDRYRTLNVPADLAASGTVPGEVSAEPPETAPSPGQLLRDLAGEATSLISIVLEQHRHYADRGGSYCVGSHYEHFTDRKAWDRHVAEIAIAATAVVLDALHK